VDAGEPEPQVRRHVSLYDLVAAGLIVAALVVALRTTRDFPGAFDPDHFRDIAQTMDYIS
jgi:hypothetical protein